MTLVALCFQVWTCSDVSSLLIWQHEVRALWDCRAFVLFVRNDCKTKILEIILSNVYFCHFLKSFLDRHLHCSFCELAVFSIHCVEQLVSPRTERLSVLFNSLSSIVFILMLFQAKPGTGLDFRSPKCEPRELDSSGKAEQWETEHHTQAKQTQKSEVYLKSSCLILTAVLQASD